MSIIDWIVMIGTLLFIAVYGIYKTRGTHNLHGYLKGGNEHKWWSICLSVMATQASAITFLSLPGQAYDDGMRFVQFYFGLPIAMILISVFFIPMYYKLKVYTAYEYLENRFDYKTRLLTAILFLTQRSFATGITIYAPAIILSQLLHWSLTFTILFIGITTTIYIVSGGAKAIAVTHRQQMTVIFLGMFTAFGFLIYYLSTYVSFGESLKVAGLLDKMNIVNYQVDITKSSFWNDRYNIISGIIGGLFLQMSYFGTDQSQVGRYLGGRSVRESRLGLLFNGLLKIPMQFFILMCGVLTFVFYQFNRPPVYFNEVALQEVRNSDYADSLQTLEEDFNFYFEQQKNMLGDELNSASLNKAANENIANYNVPAAHARLDSTQQKINTLVQKVNGGAAEDHDFIFMTFVQNYLPVGIVGLLFAVIFCASISSKSSELNALAATFVIDLYRRKLKTNESDRHYVTVSKIATVVFGILAIFFAIICSLFENLIEAVNIIGSLFYGTILGIFLTAFLLKRVRGNAVFIAAAISELIILYIDFSVRYNWNVPKIQVGYLWYNVIGCLLVMGIAMLLQLFAGNKENKQQLNSEAQV